MRQSYGKLLPGLQPAELSGKLIVIEGTDGAGRSTQINLLKPWLEEQGHAVLDTGVARSSLAGEGIRRAKEGNNLGSVTQSLFYATDFVDRLENEIVPALRAGFVVLTDRYIYSLMARAMVRGVDPNWVRKLYRMALKPDAVFYLRLGVEQLIRRVVFSRGFDYWESGMDYYPARDMYEGFCNYQKALLAEFDRLSAEYKFEIVDASADPKTVFAILKARIGRLLEAPQKQERTLARVAPIEPPARLPERAGVSRSEQDAEFEWLLVLASHLASSRDQDSFERAPLHRPSLDPILFEPTPAPQPKWEEVFELNLPPIESQINQAFELAAQALAVGSQLGKVPAQIIGNGHSNGGNGHSNGNGHGHGD